MSNNIIVGYARVSSKDQNEARQLEDFKQLGIDDRHIFIDKESGKDFKRDKYNAMLGVLREGDVVYVTSLDRLGRNYKEIGEQWENITKNIKADIVVMDMPILDTRTHNDLTGEFIADVVLKLLSYVAERERDSIRKRQAEGIAIAKSQGKYQGRKPIQVDKEAFEKIYAEVIRGERTNRYAMQKLGLKPNTYYKAVNEYKTKTGQWMD
jgi:DNA invertase Pin-like site-specific DNA recombinase